MLWRFLIHAMRPPLEACTPARASGPFSKIRARGGGGGRVFRLDLAATWAQCNLERRREEERKKDRKEKKKKGTLWK